MKPSFRNFITLMTLFTAGTTLAKKIKAEEAEQYVKDCNAGNITSCQDVGFYFYQAGDLKTAKNVFAIACYKNVQKACFNLGVLERELGDLKAAKEVFSKYCGLGDQNSCNQLADIAESSGDKLEALEVYKNSCKTDKAACYNEGALLNELGRTGEARDVLGKVCAAGLKPACKMLKTLPSGDDTPAAATTTNETAPASATVDSIPATEAAPTAPAGQ